MNTKNTKSKISFRDRLWVLQAFLHGKVLRQKAYRPQDNFFRAMPGITVRRMTTLMRWWGFRPATSDELTAFWEATAEVEKKTPLVAIDPIVTTERVRYVRTTAREPYDPAVNFYCDVVYLDEGSSAQHPSFGWLDKNRDWGDKTRFLAVLQ